jgi:hypothetical protein
MESDRKGSMLALLQAWLPILTVVFGAGWGLYTYIQHQREIEAQASVQADRDIRARLREISKPFFDRQLAVYVEAAQVVGRLRTKEIADPVWADAERRIREMQNGDIAIVSDVDVPNMLHNLSNSLDELKKSPTDDGNRKAFERDAAAVIKALRKELFQVYFAISGAKEDP